MRILVLLLFVTLSHSTFAQNRDIYKESAWAARDEWQQVDRILEALDFTPTSQIADIGCHQGYMTIRMAEKMTGNGQVHAVDIDQWKLDRLEGIADKENLEDHVLTIKGDYDDPKLPAGKLDAVLIMDTYHEMDDYKEILAHVKKSLKPDGKFVLIEPIAPEREKWSRSRQEDRHEISIRYACQDLRRAGFKILKEENPFVDRMAIKGDILWMIVATPDPSS